MLELAARRADGVAIWLGGPRYLETIALPRLRLRAGASRRSPRIVCGLPIVVTHDPPQARAAAESFLAQSSKLPAYRRVLERSGAESPADVALIGDAPEVARGLARLRDLGIDDFNAVIVPVREDPGARERTLEFLAAWNR
jgi:alkanesulfonate monooxygenase SsuD/methylene tetrahydromethanopterin reductase-like flavin-dependent oxidoreductase (luciferase family)